MVAVKDRIGLVLEHTGCTYNSLAKEIGLGRAQIFYDINNDKVKTISFQLATLINRNYPEISTDWLQTGEGEMIVPASPYTNTVNEDDLNYSVKEGIPMYNAPGTSGDIETYTDPDSEKVVGYLNFPGITKGSFALQAYGDSMHPTIENGVWVILRPIQDPGSIDWGQVYYIEFGDYRVFKRLIIGDSEDEVILFCDNQDKMLNGKPKYAPRTIKKDEIRVLCLVTDIYKKKNN